MPARIPVGKMIEMFQGTRSVKMLLVSRSFLGGFSDQVKVKIHGARIEY